jgi:hypothetical protein
VADAAWRAHDRQRQADPSDQDALLRAIVARRRAGMPVPGWMLEQRLHPAGPFASDHALTLTVHLPLEADGGARRRVVGRTPGVVDLPPHRALVAQPDAPTGEALRALAADPAVAASLHGLALGPDTRDEDLAALEAFPALERLDLAGCAALGDAGLARLACLPGLTWLDLWGLGRVTDAGLMALAGLPALATLNLRHCARVSGAGLRALAGLPSLTALDLGECRLVDDAGLAHLAGIPHLTALDLSGCAVGDAGLAHLAALPELTLLNLSRTRVTPAGLPALGRLRSLAQLFLLGCGATSAQAPRLLGGLLPRCEVVAVATE